MSSSPQKPVGFTGRSVIQRATNPSTLLGNPLIRGRGTIEKWAYPQWTYPVLEAHPEMTLGFDAAFYMTAAGVVEFSLAFALAWTPLARRAAALVLSIMFVMAVFEFGKIDAIGHSPIIVILLAIVADTARDPRRHALWAAEAWYAVAIAGFMAVYYVAHAELFGTAII